MNVKHFLALLAMPFAFTLQAQTPPSPSPEWQPVEVVNLQLEALRNNNPATDAGIATAYAFASPKNKESVGELANFSRMLHSGYADMLTHTEADLETLEVSEREAAIGVTLRLAGNSQHRYIFVLSRNDGAPCDGCWLTDGVIPVERADPPPLRQI